MPIPLTVLPEGNFNVIRMEFGERNRTAFSIGRSSIPLLRGSIAPSATNATKPSFQSESLMKFWSTTTSTNDFNSSKGKFFALTALRIWGSSAKNMCKATSDLIFRPSAGSPIPNLILSLLPIISQPERGSTACPGFSTL